MLFYSLLHWGQRCTKRKKSLGILISRRLIRVLYSCNISVAANIDETVRFSHYGLGVTIHEAATVGANTQIEVNVTIGEKEPGVAPHIGENCLIGAGAVILGNITIGNNVKVGADAVVIHNVPDNVTVVGVPGRIVQRGGERG